MTSPFFQQFYDKLADNTYRRSFSLSASVTVHIVILLLMVLDFSWGGRDFEKTPPALLMVDLSKVEIGDKTNLPPEVKEQPKKEEPKPEPVAAKQPENKTPAVNTTPSAPKEAPKPKPQPERKDAAKVETPKPTEKPKEKTKKADKKEPPKPQPKKQETPKKAAPKPNNGLQSLLASVDKVRKPVNAPTPNAAPAPTGGPTVNQGIKGGTGGSTMAKLTVSERDYIVNELRKNWNVDAGVQGIEKMIVEIRVKLNRGGDVQEAKILNMKSDPVFKSVAESARRAIYICNEKGEASPFKRLAKDRADTYSDWKDIVIQFNPMSGEIF